MRKISKLLGLCVAGGALLSACGGPAYEPVANEPVAVENAVDVAAPVNETLALDNAAAANVTEQAPVANEATPAPTETPKPAATPTPAASPTPAAVERPAQFAMCTTCHSVEKGAPNRIGPNLFGVVGSKAGSKPGFAYSDAMKGSGITWTAAELESFLLAPQAKVPGTKMMVKGPADEKARKAIVDYLASLK